MNKQPEQFCRRSPNGYPSVASSKTKSNSEYTKKKKKYEKKCSDLFDCNRMKNIHKSNEISEHIIFKC